MDSMNTIGIDLVYIPGFQKRLDMSGGLGAIFTDGELQQNLRLESLAGVFGAKEAFMKAIGKKIDWHDVWVEKLENGKPIIASPHVPIHQKADVSISHDGDYAIATVVLFKL